MKKMKSMTMEEQKIHLIRLEKGEELATSLLAYIKQHNIQAGFINAIGAFAKGTYGYFDVDKKEYVNTSFSKVELLSCTGNIAVNKDTKEPIAHVHIIVGDKDGNCYGGHLIKAIVSVTVEITLVETLPRVYREKDDATELYLLEPKN
jgi:hypothetical protein